jgi:hypothetical protein
LLDELSGIGGTSGRLVLMTTLLAQRGNRFGCTIPRSFLPYAALNGRSRISALLLGNSSILLAALLAKLLDRLGSCRTTAHRCAGDYESEYGGTDISCAVARRAPKARFRAAVYRHELFSAMNFGGGRRFLELLPVPKTPG